MLRQPATAATQEMYHQIDQTISKCTLLEVGELTAFHSVLQYKAIKKKTFLLRQGEVSDFECYIIKGCAKKYYIDDNGFEVILQFAIEDWWIGDIASSTTFKPSNVFIETIEDTEVFLITHADKERLYMQVPKMERVFRLMIQRSYAILQDRLFATFSQTAEERYLDFLDRYPTIPQRVSQHQIAAYLGITPEFLSKIRAKIAAKRMK